MTDHNRFALCFKCRKPFAKKSLYTSAGNLLYCPNCFSGKNTQGPQIAQHVRRHKIFKNIEIYVKKKVNSPVDKMTLSRRSSYCTEPIHCPHTDCNKFISVFTLESHFRYDHKQVPIILSHFDARCSMEFRTRDVRYGVTQCIVLLSVINRDFSAPLHSDKGTVKKCSVGTLPTRSQLELIDSRPILIVLATRIAHFQLDNQINSLKDEEVVNPPPLPEDDSLFVTKDKVIIWLSSNVQTNYRYTVAVSTLNNRFREKYYGPLVSLDDKPVKICNEGKCLILSQINYKVLTDNGNKPLTLDVVIHKD